MQTYKVGRFAIDVPAEIKKEVQTQRIRYAEIDVFEWARASDHEIARTSLWNSRLAKINSLHRPEEINDIIIQQRELPGLGIWARGVQYYGDYIIPERHFWTVLVDYGRTGVWLTISGTNDQMSLANTENILKHYTEIASARHAFHLNEGEIDLPYLEQECTYTRFKGGRHSLQLELETNETKELERLSLAERLAAAVETRFAPGVDVQTIRSRARTAAGLKGEELVVRMSARGEGTQIQFCWEYHGEVDSGERPEIQLTMEATDDDLDEKLKIWDLIVDSMKPLYQ